MTQTLFAHQAAAAAPPRLVQPPDHNARFSEGAAAYLARKAQDGARASVLAHIRMVFWSLVQHWRCDPPLRELTADSLACWLEALRTEPIRRRGRGGYPREISPASVQAFLDWPGFQRKTQQFRDPNTIAFYRDVASGLFRWLRLPVDLEAKARRNFAPLPPIVSEIDALSAQFAGILSCGQAPALQLEQIVLIKALILIWGVRLEEALTTPLARCEKHWCLVLGKTSRLTYLNAQALGIVRRLSQIEAWALTAKQHMVRRSRLSAWPWTDRKWHALVALCGASGDVARPQHDLRKRWSSWVQDRDRDVERLLGGHGGDIVDRRYVDTLRKVPGVMEFFALPPVDGFNWPAPVYLYRPAEATSWSPEEEAAAVRIDLPRRLYAEYDAWRRAQ